MLLYDSPNVWKGKSDDEITGVFCTVASLKKDAERKIVIGFSELERLEIDKVLNSNFMSEIYISIPGLR